MNTVGPKMVRDEAVGYVARIRKDGLRHARREFDAMAMSREQRRKAESAKREKMRRALWVELRNGLVPLREQKW